MRLAIIIAGCCFAASTAAAEDCKALTDPAKRLECFDKATPAKPVATPNTTPKPKPPAKSAPAKNVDDGWELKTSKDNFSDKTTCVVSPIGRPWVQLNVNNLYISYAGKGGVAGYTLRFDDQPPRQMQLPTPIDQQIGAVHLSPADFAEAMNSDRVRVQTFTVLRELKDEDLKMAGAKRLYQKMGPECSAR